MQRAPLYTALRVFGCKCFPHLKPYATNKLDPKSLLCVFLGYNDKYKGYRCYHPPTKTVYISRHVLFDEKVFPYDVIYSQYRGLPTTSLMSVWYSGSALADTSPVEEFSVPPPDPPPVQFVPSAPTVPPTESDFSPDLTPPSPVPQPAVTAPTHSMTTRGQHGIRKPNSRYALLNIKTDYPIPRTTKQALQDKRWTGAMGT